MVDYTYHGSGDVTVSPSKYQTGGSGFSSSGTYRSEAEARSAVSSGTRTGAIQTEQQQRKAKIFASPAAQWSSAEARNEAYISYLRSGGPPVAQLGGVVPTSTMAERRAEAAQYEAMQPQAKQVSSTPLLTAAMQRTSFDYQYDLGKPISKQEYLAKRGEPDPFTGLRKAAPITAPFYEGASGLSAGLQKGFEGIIGYSETSHPVKKIFVGAGSLVTGLPQMAGITAVVGEWSVRHVTELPTAIYKGMPMLGGQLAEQAKKQPWETAGMVAGMVVGPKIAKSVSERLPSVKVRGIETPSAKGFIDNVAGEPITKWTPSKTNPVWTAGKGWSPVPESAKIPITQWKPSVTNPVWTAGKGWSNVAAPVAAGMTYQGLSVEHGRKAQPILGITDQPVINKASLKIGGKTIVAGTPKFRPEAVPDMFKARFTSEAGYREFTSPTEYAIATKNILPTYDAPTQELFGATIAKRQLTFGVKSTHKLTDVPLEDVFKRHDLKLTTQKNLRAYMAKQKDLVLWGSTANKAQVMGKGGVGYFREIKDIDIHVKDPLKTTRELYDIIGRTEKKGFVTMKGGGLATAKGHLFDIKSIEGGLPKEWSLSGSELPAEGKVFLFGSEKPGKIGKFKVQSLSDQTTSKLSSIGLRTKTISAAAHRAGKDPFDLAFINEPSLTMDIGKSWNPFKRLSVGKAKALDIKIQELTEAKIKSQPIGKLPGQITLPQKKMFFENIAALRSGQSIVSLPSKEILYTSRRASSKPLTSNMLTGMGTGISSVSMSGTAKRAGISTDISKQIRKDVKQSGYYPTSKTSRSTRITSPSLSFSTGKSPSPIIPYSGGGRSPRIPGSPPVYKPPRSPPPYSPPSYKTPKYPKVSPPSYPQRHPPNPFITRVPERKPIKMPKTKMTVNLPKALKPKGFGKFPEISRVAGTKDILGGMFGKVAKPKKKSGKGKKSKKKR